MVDISKCRYMLFQVYMKMKSERFLYTTFQLIFSSGGSFTLFEGSQSQGSIRDPLKVGEGIRLADAFTC